MTSPKLSEAVPAMVDANGYSWWHFCFEYDWEGAIWGFHICARSKEEAEARLKRLPLARYVGQMDGHPLPANLATSIYVRTWVWFKNLERLFP